MALAIPDPATAQAPLPGTSAPTPIPTTTTAPAVTPAAPSPYATPIQAQPMTGSTAPAAKVATPATPAAPALGSTATPTAVPVAAPAPATGATAQPPAPPKPARRTTPIPIGGGPTSQVGQAKQQATVQKSSAAPTATASPTGTSAKGTAGAAGNTPPAPPAAPGDTSGDLLKQLQDYATRMMNTTEDPVSKAQFNQLLTSVAAQNSNTLQGIRQQIANSPNMPQGAGDALLAFTAMGMNANLADVQQKLSVQAAQTIHDLNQWGWNGLSAVQAARQNMATDSMNAQLKAGNYDAYGKAFESLYGMPIDTSHLRAQDPLRVSGFTNSWNTVQDLINQGKPEDAKAYAMQLAGAYYDVMGYSTPQEAQDAIGKEDFTLQAFQAKAAASKTIQDTLSQAALSGDETTLRSATSQWFTSNNLDPAQVGANLLQTMPLNGDPYTGTIGINDVLTAMGDQPITDKSQLVGIDKGEFAIQQKMLAEKAGAKATPVDIAMKDLNNDPTYKAAFSRDPDTERQMRAYLMAQQIGGNVTFDAKTGMPVFSNGMAPTDPNSPISYLFTDWPVGTVGADGKMSTVGGYAGFEPYQDAKDYSNVSSNYGQYSKDLDSKWEQYALSTPAASRLSRSDWWYATLGGTQAPDPTKIPGGATNSGSTTSGDLIKDGTVTVQNGKIMVDNKPMNAEDLTNLQLQAISTNRASMDALVQAGQIKPAQIPTVGSTLAMQRWLRENGIGGYSYNPETNNISWSKGPVIMMNGNLYRLTRGQDTRNGFDMYAINLATGKEENIA